MQTLNGRRVHQAVSASVPVLDGCRDEFLTRDTGDSRELGLSVK